MKENIKYLKNIMIALYKCRLYDALYGLYAKNFGRNIDE